jgi:hypothetical protein
VGPVAAGRVAVVGGRGHAGPLERFGDGVVMFGSRESAGAGPVRRLEAALRSGSYGTVIVLARWIAHSTADRVRHVCRTTGTRLVVWPGGLSSLALALEEDSMP